MGICAETGKTRKTSAVSTTSASARGQRLIPESGGAKRLPADLSPRTSSKVNSSMPSESAEATEASVDSAVVREKLAPTPTPSMTLSSGNRLMPSAAASPMTSEQLNYETVNSPKLSSL